MLSNSGLDIARRRVVIAAAAFPLLLGRLSSALAKPPGHLVRVGILSITEPKFDPVGNPFHRELVEGLRELGYTPDRDLVFEFRSANGEASAFAPLAADLAAAKIDVLLIRGTEPVIDAAKVVKHVPILMVGTMDPVETGLVTSLARPGGNVTGLAIDAAEMAAKRVQLLQEVVPGLTRVAVLWNQSVQSMTLGYNSIARASPVLGVAIQSIGVSSPADFNDAFARMERGQPHGLVVLYGPLKGDDLPRIIRFASARRLPTIFQPIEAGARGGGLMEFGAKTLPMARRAASYIDRIANGQNPADIPVEEPTAFELTINLKAAKELGIEIPHAMLLRADRLIE
jgi:putative tryptophan/tyrosine transport system substrate-binding protein